MNTDALPDSFPDRLEGRDGSLTITQAGSIVLVLLLLSIPLAIPTLLTNWLYDEKGVDLYGVSELLVFATGLWLTIRWAQRRYGIDAPDLTPANRHIVPLMVYPLLLAGTLCLGILIEPLTVLVPTPDWLKKALEEAFTKNVILSAVIGAPVFEEWLFRGVILAGFLKRYSPTTAIVLSATIFALIHLNPAQSIGAFFIGLALGWLFYRTGSLWPGMVVHFINNAASSLVFLSDETMDMTTNTTLAWVGNSTNYIILLALSAAVVTGCYLGLNRLLPRAIPRQIRVA